MGTETLDQEFASIKSIILALEPLSPESRAFVIEAVFKKLNIEALPTHPAPLENPANVPEAAPVHIKAFKDEKKPSSINEMVALVAFYLANLAPIKDRKETITSKDVETQFKIAGYRLPKELRATLSNTAQTGYVEMLRKGVYKLTPIGYNLVAHTLPRHP